MKKYLTIGLVVLVIGIAKAQEVKFGVKGGLNLMKISDEQVKGTSTVGFHLGGLAAIKLSDKFTLQPELLYSTKGTKESYYGIEMKTNLSYIDLPIMAKYFIVEGLSVEAGPQIGYLVSAKGSSNSEYAVFENNFKTIDYGLNLGTGYELKEGLLFQLRYYFGLADISKAIPYYDMNPKTHINGLQVSVGYKF
ncbi:porin family protein [Flavobacterium sp. SUN046]|uniref:porin family protein n=1 Tax=Flavobacterium sp. SUN046 TaxID=3002440 RepID=UPI002DBCE6F8|nr:porin family protein [Flavobacterium sp. SUN046]MEC4050171.1 porin family protein [Flavobacterium sp. SUN046]